MGELLQRDDWRTLSGQPGPAPQHAELEMPILQPGKILCAGLNYYAHAEEVGQESRSTPPSSPSSPTRWSARRTTWCCPRPAKIDWEAELTVVIGSRVRQADEAGARAAIAGYTVMNDVSVRDWQGRTSEWFQGKNWDRMTPVGPVVVTADELDPEAGLAVECELDGATKQSGNTSDLIFSCASWCPTSASS